MLPSPAVCCFPHFREVPGERISGTPLCLEGDNTRVAIRLIRRHARCRDQGCDRVYVALRRRRIGRRDLGRDSLRVATSVLRQVSLPSSGRARVGRRRRGGSLGESSQQRQGARRVEETGR
ncbi:hypothetical protein Taro_019764 [Colocasia esculenta]|uniref:Uncharacterized protein n=1 Tax=Colocasia esculenta TaxID=4460 RepID=A0A843V368_COLES|nr:hypothetical protein [Colocasia esculenta]